MNVGFWAFDVIMKVIPQRMNQVDGIIAFVFARVAREENESDVSDIVAHSGIGTWKYH